MSTRPSECSPRSAFKSIRARLSILAGAVPAEMSLRKRLRSSLVSSTTYFFMAALLLGLNWPQDRTSRSEHQIIVDRGLEGFFSEIGHPQVMLDSASGRRSLSSPF